MNDQNREPNPEQEPGTRNQEPGTVLVTGTAGFAGGYLMERLARAGVPVVGWSRRDVDLLDRDAVRVRIAELKPAAIYHLAGAPHVGESWGHAARTLRVNVLATHYLLDAVRRAGIRCRVLVTGSAAVYRSSDVPIDENGPLAPSSPYAMSKLAQEQLAFRAVGEDGIEIVLARPFNHTGPRQPASYSAPGFARQLALIEAGRIAPIIKVGNLESSRDISDVRDTVRAYELLMTRGRVGVPYNVCSGVGHSIGELLERLCSRVPVRVKIEIDAERLRPNDTTALVGNPARLHADTGWTPEFPLDRTLDDLLDYWRAEVARG